MLDSTNKISQEQLLNAMEETLNALRSIEDATPVTNSDLKLILSATTMSFMILEAKLRNEFRK